MKYKQSQHKVRLMVAIASIVLLCGLVGCTPIRLGLPGKDQQAQAVKDQRDKQLPKAESMQIPIGKIHFVDQQAGFVLIKSSRTRQLEPGTPIVAYSSTTATVSARMMASPATKSSFLAADLAEGVPRVGDIVTIVHTTSQGSAESTPGTAADQSNSQIQVLE